MPEYVLTEPTAAGEHVVLDPSEVAEDRTELDITAWIRQEGIDWGDAEIQGYVAEQARGESPVDFRIPNRLITVPLIEAESGGTAHATIRSKIQSKVARLQQEGGWLKRVTNGGGTVFADVVNASLRHSSVAGWESRANVDIEAQLTLEVIPDFYGAEITLDDHTETTEAELIFTETGIDGDYPARVRIVVDEDDGEIQRGLIWSLRSRHYSAADTARTAYECEALDLGTGASATANADASGGTVVRDASGGPFGPAVELNLGGTAPFTHTGTNRVFVRAKSPQGTAMSLSFRWTIGGDIGDYPITNAPYQFPGTAFVIADLGEVRLDSAPSGPHHWSGVIERLDDTAGTIDLDRVWVINADEAMGVLSAPSGFELVSANQSIELSTEGMYREVVAGTAFHRATFVTGDLPRLPPAGLENRTTEVFVKMSRGELDRDGLTVADAGIDDLSAQVFYRPSWLFVPET